MNQAEIKLRKKNRDLLKEICARYTGEAFYYGKGARALTETEKESAADIADELKNELVQKFQIQI